MRCPVVVRRLMPAALAACLCACSSLPTRPQAVDRELPVLVTAPASSARALAHDIAAYLAQPRFSGAHWGIHVVELDSGRTLVSYAGDRRANPASNAKLYSGALALAVLGADENFVTSLLAAAAPSANGELHGDLILRGGGDPDEGRLVEGTGLTRTDLVTPRATAALLVHAARQPWADAFFDALPIAGVDGTLRNRLRGTVAEGRLRAKTGTLSYTHALGGVVDSADGVRLGFALMLDRYVPPAAGSALPGPRDDIDAIAKMIAESRVR